MSLPLPDQQLSQLSQPSPATASTADNSPPQHVQDQDVTEAHMAANAWTSERPLDVKPAPEGGVAIGGQPNLPEGHANIGDKIVGKTQKVIGKITLNSELHERGELRETGGKAAAEGRARAAHD